LIQWIFWMVQPLKKLSIMEQPDRQVRTGKETHCIVHNTEGTTATGLTTGMTCVTPSPLSTTIPVRVRSLTDLEPMM
jgi:hypothetical protein